MDRGRRLGLVLVPLALNLTLLSAEARGGPDRAGSGAVCEPAPNCRVGCVGEALELWRACWRSDESRRECRARARAQYDACLESACAPAPDCEDRCELRSAELLRRCLSAGGSAASCRRDAEAALDACVEAQCEEPCFCLHAFKPVCGVDGVTYSNACEADCAGVEIEHEGICQPRCAPVVCQLFCEHGFARDPRSGCEICECAPPPRCEPVVCRLFCEHGFARDPRSGCEICECAPPPR
jgi:hypothetical protein